ncbi:MAG TPA: dihydrolipoamide acetyltransferase family protein [Anaerolineae bacterium]|nr:dihydrolipoamide acetyltransferase family protein [Anaerolineae bacterium]HQI85555.1 dihydrolipoamide acetyltransferase family protein [Anaerolineae bacterium]
MAREFRLPDLGEGIHEGEVLAVKVRVGQQVKEDETILEVETDKAAVEIPSPYSDVVTQINVKAGDTVHVGDVLLVFGDGAGAQEAGNKVQEMPPATIAPASTATLTADYNPALPVAAAPSTRRLARELGVDLRTVTPTGPGGRVTEADVRAHASGKAASPVAEAVVEPTPLPQNLAVAPTPVASPLPAYDQLGLIERLPLRSIRRATARQMALAWAQIPHVSTQDVVDVTALEALRQQYKADVEARGGKLTLTVFVLKALVNALKEFPKFNASLDVETEEIVLKKYYNTGVAVDSERGLIVPVLRDVDRKSIVELAVELTALVERTRDGKASLADMQGGTITVTNIGALGGKGFSPIINYPEVAILGLAKASVQPVARPKRNGGYKFVPRLMLPIILAFDHRVNDGAEAQRFLNRIIEQLENPEKLLLGL